MGVDLTGDDFFGVVIGNAPLVVQKDLLYFEVKVHKVDAAEIHDDGLVIGVSAKPPEQVLDWEKVETGDEVPMAWGIGGEGLAYAHYDEKMRKISWNPKD